MLEVVGPLLGAITLALQRRDRREDLARDGIDYQRALLALYEVARDWADLAKDLRNRVDDWFAEGCPSGLDMGVNAASVYKASRVHAFGEIMRSPDGRELRRLLQVHAPELLRDLESTQERSYENLRSLVTDLGRAQRRGPAELRQFRIGFNQRTDEVIGAVESLRVFIADNFPLSKS